MLDPLPLPGPAPAPRLPGRVTVRPEVDDTIGALAAELYMQALACVRNFGDFHLALSGGSTPMPLYRRLMIDPLYRELPWRKTHLWIVDERRVEFTDERSNFKQIQELIVDHSDIPPQQVHPIHATREHADSDYERTLRETLEWREKGQDRLDYVLLGMGADAHTASLFPNSPAQLERERLVAINAGPKVTPPDRVTMTYRLLNASRLLAVLVTGESKRATIAKIARACEGPVTEQLVGELPILGVKPLAGELHWYLDQPAAG